jgi:hypothetical protein
MESQTKLWTFIEIVATISLICGVALNSYNIYPANLYVNIFGNFFWLLLGISWKKWSLIIIEIITLAIYFSGLFKYVYNNDCFFC